jgi:hypothetical protein
MKNKILPFFAILFLLINEFTFAQNLSISQILSPTNYVGCISYNDSLILEIQNNSTDTIHQNSTWFYLNINNILDSISIPHRDLAINEKDTIHLPLSFSNYGKYAVMGYINPLDTFNIGDTIIFNIYVQLSGEYSVDPSLPTGMTNFSSLNDMAKALLGGVCGQVNIKIANGLYNEQFILWEAPGVNASNNITITSEANNADSVIIAYTPSGISNNYIIGIRGLDYLTLEHLTLQNNSSSFGHIITIDSSSTHNNYQYLKLIGSQTTSTSIDMALIHSSAGINTLDSISNYYNNLLSGGSYGMYLYGNNINHEKYVNIKNNTFINQYNCGIFTYYLSDFTIDSNYIVTNSNNNNFNGIYTRYGRGNIKISRNQIFAKHASGDFLYVRDLEGDINNPILVDNNFIVQDGGTATVRALYPYNCKYLDIVYNTVKVFGGSSTGGRAIYINKSTGGDYNNLKVLNNIFVNTGGGYAIEVSATALTESYLSFLNNNEYYSTGTYLAKAGTTNCTNLIQWQTAMSSYSFDTQSISYDPQFINDSSFVFTNIGLDNTAIPYAGINYDIAGNIRSSSHPDPGCYEFHTLEHDINAIAIIAPISSCGLSNEEFVSVLIANNGSNDEVNIPISLSNDGGISWPINEIIPSLTAGDTITYTFSQGLNMSIPQSYNIAIKANLSTDENPVNNLKNVTITNYPYITNFPYIESFESNDGMWSSGGVNNSWQWGIPNGSLIDTASDGTHAWVTNLTGNYNTNEKSYVQSPCFDFSNLSDPWIYIDLWYECETGWDGANLQYSTNLGNTWNTIGTFGEANWYNMTNVTSLNTPGWSGNTALGSAGYLTMSHSLLPAAGYSQVTFRINFGSNMINNNFDGVAFDNIKIIERGKNIGLVDIVFPDNDCGFSNNVPITVEAFNNGTVVQHNIPIRFSDDNGSTWLLDTIPFINSHDTILFTSNVNFDFSSIGIHNIAAEIILDNDSITSDNYVEKTFYNSTFINTYPYSDDFETDTNTWINYGNWTYNPIGSVINAAYSGNHALYIAGNIDTVSMLISPCFDLSQITHPVIEFYQYMNVNDPASGGVLQYSVDNGDNWVNLGNVGDTLNWYNTSSINSLNNVSNGIGFSTNTSGWVMSRHNLFALSGETKVRFRFVFASSDFETGDGWAIDDFQIYNKIGADITIDSLLYPVSDCQLADTTLTIRIRNYSPLTINAGAPMTLSVWQDNQFIFNENFSLSQTLNANESMIYTTNNSLNLSLIPHTYHLKASIYYNQDINPDNDTVNFIVKSYGYPTVSAIFHDSTICWDEHVILYANGNALYYVWQPMNDTSAFIIIDSTKVPDIGSYQYLVYGYNQYGCYTTDTVNITIDDCSSIADNIISNPFVYPNPSNGTIYLSGLPIGNYTLSLIDLSGKLLFSKDINISYDNLLINLPENINEGVYILNIDNSHKQWKKLIQIIK